ncbi:MAG: hypothetical protein ACRC1P_02600 [Cellulosilyticaceae bacterium]
MSKFGCIDFSLDNIILSKEGMEKTKIKGVFFEPICYLGIKGYNIHILGTPDSISNKIWKKIEDVLLQRNIFYVAMDNKEIKFPFENVKQAKGEVIKILLAPHIQDYIFKYKLIEVDEKYAKIGVIAGKINTTLDVLMPIVDKVTEIVIFSEEPRVYREIVQEIYKKTKIRIKLMYPNKRVIKEMDILYDVNEVNSYADWCKVKAIYIDFFKNVKSQALKLNELPPSIWQDFDIVCEKHTIDKSVFEAMLYTDGFSRQVLRKKIKNFDIIISRVYTLSRS